MSGGTKKSEKKSLELRAGDLSMVYEDGSLRRIRWGETEIVRMIYSAVRDRNWGTVNPVIEDEKIDVTNHSFQISLTVSYQEGSIQFRSAYLITGEKNKIRFEMNGQAQSDFLKNRIGFCVLHPIRECAGKSANAFHPDGSISDFIFPENISPQQPVGNLRAMSWNPGENISAKIEFLGDIFEMEDQRNWTDASFKTYCTPLEWPFPAEIRKGEQVCQSIELLVDAPELKETRNNDFRFSWNSRLTYPLPKLGLSVSSRTERLSSSEIELLQKLSMSHLRVEVRMKQPDVKQVFEKIKQESSLLGWPLFVVLYLSSDFEEEYRQFVSLCNDLKPKMGYLLPVGLNHLPFTRFNELSRLIRTDFPQTLVGTGVNAYFAELNRNRPEAYESDFVSFTVCPQVHAFDDVSLVENLEAQAEVIQSARHLFPEKPVFVSPVSLRQRFNVVATADEPNPEPGTLPSSVDPRQRTAFTAGWTLGSLKFLARAGCALITYYETLGWKGVIQGEMPSAVNQKFPAEPNEIFPVFQFLKEIAGFSRVIDSRSSHPLNFDGLILESDQKNKLLLFNFQENEADVTLEQSIYPTSLYSLNYPDPPEMNGMRIKLRSRDLVIIHF